ncbi:peptidase MA family metallohydrolase [Candidatus Neomarinimicrobiota bacterium]
MKKSTTIIVTLLIALLPATALPQFGKNIVQYDKYNWQFIQTEQFDIYFYGDNIELAEYVSEVASEAYTYLSDRLNWELKKRVSVMVYQSHADFQQNNVIFSFMQEGILGVTELYKNRVVLPFEGDYEAFHHTLRHELVHAMINDLVYGGNLQSVVSGRIRYAIPGWMNEGLADYLAGEWDPTADMYMRDLALSGEILDIPYLGGLYAYHGGKSVWMYITSQYGEEAIAEIFGQIKAKASVERGLKAAIGQDFEQLSEAWRESLKKQYWPDVAGRDRLKDIAYKVTDHQKEGNVYNVAPSISPDGSKIALLRNHFGTMEIILISATDGRFIKRLVKGGTRGDFEELHLMRPGIAWSPDGDKVAFAAKASNKEILFVVDISKGRTRKYQTGVEGVFMATWNPKRDEIAFAGNNGSRGDLYLLNLETEQITNLTDDVFGIYNPVWSPDGETIAFSSDRGDYPPYRYDGDGKEYLYHMRVDPMVGSKLSSVKPNFKHVDYSFSNREIFTLQRDGTNLVRITNYASHEDYPVYLNDANYLFYTSDRSGISNIYMRDLDTGEERSVTNILTGIADLNMASDDSRLYFTGFADAGFDIFSISNPLDMWDEPKEILPSNYLLAERAADWDELVNNDRTARHQEYASDYSRYVFGLDRPNNFSVVATDTVAAEVISPERYVDEDGRPNVYPYKTKFSLDLVQSYAGYSTLYSFQGMTQFLFSDMMGNHRISFATEMQISLENSDYYLTYHLLPFRTNYYFTLFHTAYIYQSSYFRLNRLRHYGIDAIASLPVNRYHRFDFGLTATNVENTVFEDAIGDGRFVEMTSHGLPTVLPHIGHVWDNVEWSYMFPVSGWRTQVTATTSTGINNTISFNTLTYDVRRYFRLFGGTSIAARVSGGASFGRDAQSFLVGGLPWLFSDEEQDANGNTRYAQNPFGTNLDITEQLKRIYFSEYLTPLRGTKMMEMVADRAALFNLEYRFPFLLYYFPALRMLGQIGGVLFTDYGVVWGNVADGNGGTEVKKQTVHTYGWGPRFIFLGLPFQLDYAYQVDPPPGESKKHWYLTIGLDF